MDDFKNIFFRNKLNSEAKNVYDEIKEQIKKIDFIKLVCIGSGKHKYNGTIFLDLKTFAESLYDGNLLHIIPEETDELLTSVNHRKRKTRKERVRDKHD